MTLPDKTKQTDYWSSWQRPAARCPRWLAEAEELASRLRVWAPFMSTGRVLDFGCGQGLVAARLAADVPAIDLWDSSEVGRAQAQAVCKDLPNASVLTRLPETATYAFILVSSVTQYMTGSELQDAMLLWKKMLLPNGHVLLTDIIAPPRRVGSEIGALIRFSFRNSLVMHMVLEAIRGLPGYWRRSQKQPLTHYDSETIQKLAESAGFAIRGVDNPNMFQSRFAVLLKPA